jgi:hypothetical protein
MFGTFNEAAIAAYEELVSTAYREKRVRAHQGTEQHDNHGIGETDHSFIDSEESQDAEDYSESWDFTACIRSDGTTYGIANGKKCRKGTETKVEPKQKPGQDKKREAIQKRGQKAVTKAKAEKVLSDLAKQGRTNKKAAERREKAGGGNREEQVRRLGGKVYLAMDKLRQQVKRLKEGPRKQRLLARIERLQALRQRLDKEQRRLREQAPKAKSEGWGKLPDWATEGRSLA